MIFLVIVAAFVLVTHAAREMGQSLTKLELAPVTLDPHNLPEYALRTTLRMFAAIIASLVFTFVVATLAANSARLGEPWLNFFDTSEMEALLRRVGFASVVHFGPEEAHRRYLRGRTDGSRMPAYFRMAKATTDPISDRA